MNQESEPIKISKDSDKISLEDAINAVTPQFSSETQQTEDETQQQQLHHQSANSDEIIKHFEIENMTTGSTAVDDESDNDYDFYDQIAEDQAKKNTEIQSNMNSKKNAKSNEKEEGELDDEDDEDNIEYDTAFELNPIVSVKGVAQMSNLNSEKTKLTAAVTSYSNVTQVEFESAATVHALKGEDDDYQDYDDDFEDANALKIQEEEEQPQVDSDEANKPKELTYKLPELDSVITSKQNELELAICDEIKLNKEVSSVPVQSNELVSKEIESTSNEDHEDETGTSRKRLRIDESVPDVKIAVSATSTKSDLSSISLGEEDEKNKYAKSSGEMSPSTISVVSVQSSNAENPDKEKELKTHLPKVPPLKIMICSNRSGDGLPYVKPTIEGKQHQSIKQQQQPLVTTRSKARAASPVAVPTNVSSTVSGSKTPSRRSDRTSPATTTTINHANQEITISIEGSSVSSNAAAAAAAEASLRRKLRSHTRSGQLHGDSASSASAIKSPSSSPLTIACTNSNEGSSFEDQLQSNQQQDESNSMDCETPVSTTLTGGIDMTSGIVTRKRRYNPTQTAFNIKDQVSNSPSTASNFSVSDSANVLTTSSEETETKIEPSKAEEIIQSTVEGTIDTIAHLAVYESTEEDELQKEAAELEAVTATIAAGLEPSEIEQMEASINDRPLCDLPPPPPPPSSIVIDTSDMNTSESAPLSNTESSINTISLNASVQQQPINCIKKLIDIRNEISKRRNALTNKHVELKLPSNIQDFALYKKSYLIRSNQDAKHAIPFFKPPHDLPEELKDYFLKQEKERYLFRMRHKVEQDKLVILYEQEVLRCFNRLSRNELNQSVPFSFCTMIKDDEVYSEFKQQQLIDTTNSTDANPISNHPNTDSAKNSRITNEREKFLANLDETRAKFCKLKDDLIKRQLNESDSLFAVQKMDFQSKLREIKEMSKSKTNAQNANSVTNSNANNQVYSMLQHFTPSELHVPIVRVNNKFDLIETRC